jgi:hypothetical protein
MTRIAPRTTNPTTITATTNAASATATTVSTSDATVADATSAPAKPAASSEAQSAARAKFAAVGRPSVKAEDAAQPPAVDVGSATKESIGEMKKSKDQRVRAMATTVERAQKAYASVIDGGGRVTVSTSAGNGGKPVVTLVPPGFDPTKPARVHTHYHGWNATAADPIGHSSGTTARIAEIQKADPQTVFVLPDCANSQAGSYHADWSNVKSQAQTTNDALAAAGVDNVTRRTVSAHSAGGFALQRAMASKADGSGVQADRLELDDCLYGPEKQIAAWAQTPAGQAAKSVVYFRGTNDVGRDKDIARNFGDKYQRVAVAAPKKGEVPLVDGKPKYAGDAHDRTVAEFMDT